MVRLIILSHAQKLLVYIIQFLFADKKYHYFIVTLVIEIGIDVLFVLVFSSFSFPLNFAPMVTVHQYWIVKLLSLQELFY